VPDLAIQPRFGSPFDSSEPVSSMEGVSRTCCGGRDGFGVTVGVTVEGFVVAVGVASDGVEVGVPGVVGTVGVDVGVDIGVLSAAGFKSLLQATSSRHIATTPAVPVNLAFFHPPVNMSPTFS
jgi:hypothetical protein